MSDLGPISRALVMAIRSSGSFSSAEESDEARSRQSFSRTIRQPERMKAYDHTEMPPLASARADLLPLSMETETDQEPFQSSLPQASHTHWPVINAVILTLCLILLVAIIVAAWLFRCHRHRQRQNVEESLTSESEGLSEHSLHRSAPPDKLDVELSTFSLAAEPAFAESERAESIILPVDEQCQDAERLGWSLRNLSPVARFAHAAAELGRDQNCKIPARDGSSKDVLGGVDAGTLKNF